MGPREVRDRYIEAFVTLEPRNARRVIRQAREDGMSADQLYLEVLAPALREIGTRWQRGSVSIGTEHLATTVTSRLLAELAPQLSARAAGRPGTALVACPAPEQHCLGAQMVADFLEGAGWQVDLLAGPTPPNEVARLARRLRPDLVALSTTLQWHLVSARTTVELLGQQAPDVRVAVGGQAYREVEDPLPHIGAHAYARTPAELLLALTA